MSRSRPGRSRPRSCCRMGGVFGIRRRQPRAPLGCASGAGGSATVDDAHDPRRCAIHPGDALSASMPPCSQVFFPCEKNLQEKVYKTAKYPIISMGLYSAHAQVLDLQEVLDAVFRTFAAGTGFLHAAERRDLS